MAGVCGTLTICASPFMVIQVSLAIHPPKSNNPLIGGVITYTLTDDWLAIGIKHPKVESQVIAQYTYIDYVTETKDFFILVVASPLQRYPIDKAKMSESGANDLRVFLQRYFPGRKYRSVGW
jgi:hypothetical protein